MMVIKGKKIDNQLIFHSSRGKAFSHLIYVEDVIARQFSLAHGTNHDVTQLGKVSLAYRYIGSIGIRLQVNIENLWNCLSHFHDPLSANTVHSVLITSDSIADGIIANTAMRMWARAASVVLWAGRCRESFTRLLLVRGTVGTSINMTETRVTQAAILSELFLAWSDVNVMELVS